MLQNVQLLCEINDLKKERHTRKKDLRRLHNMDMQKKNHNAEDLMQISEDNTEALQLRDQIKIVNSEIDLMQHQCQQLDHQLKMLRHKKEMKLAQLQQDVQRLQPQAEASPEDPINSNDDKIKHDDAKQAAANQND